MRISSLILEHFRSYEQLALSFGGGDVHVFIGPNAVGKTNLLEAISVLSGRKSFLGIDDADLIRWGNDFYRVRVECVSDAGANQTAEIVSQSAPRKARASFLNDVRVPLTQLLGAVPSVHFLPQDLELFVGIPARRRALLNDLLSQVSVEFAKSLSTYEKALRQRNALLKKIADGIVREDEIAVWDEILAREGAIITLSHLELIKMLQCTLAEELSAMGETWDNVELVYERNGEAATSDGLTSEFLKSFQNARIRDLAIGATTVGPHRHDWRMDKDGRSLTTFASRGQQRAAVLALLFLEVSYMELKRNEKPVVLLDDVFSELDRDHQSRLLHSLGGHQVLLTATHLPPLAKGVSVWEVGEGAVRGRKITVSHR